MRRRFLADQILGDRAALLGAHAAHLARVLRARPGQEFDIAAQGRVRRGRVLEVADDRVVLALGEDVPEATSPGELSVWLWLSIFKFDRMEWAIEKATELGATRILPLIAARTDAHLAAAAPKRVDRWRRIARQASEQSRRTLAPEIVAPEKLRRETISVPGLRLLLSEAENHIGLRAALTLNHVPEPLRQAAGSDGEFAEPGETRSPSPVCLHLAIGPEGGWTEAERKLFADCGWISASLGPTILRAETAALAALAVVISELSQL